MALLVRHITLHAKSLDSIIRIDPDYKINSELFVYNFMEIDRFVDGIKFAVS